MFYRAIFADAAHLSTRKVGSKKIIVIIAPIKQEFNPIYL
jgi:hypothetical protein